MTNGAGYSKVLEVISPWKSLRWLAVLAAVSVVMAPLTLVPAEAASISSAITGVTIDGTPPTQAGNEFKVNATWAVPDGSHAGDTFTLNFPAAAKGFLSTISLDDATGAVVGTCVVTNSSFTCTLSDYVETHTNVHGTLWFKAVAQQSTDDHLDFTAGGGAIFVVDLPAPISGGGSGSAPSPKKLEKYGATNSSTGGVYYGVDLPASGATANGVDVPFVDTYDARLTLVPNSFGVTYWSGGEPANGGHRVPIPQGTGPNTYTLSLDPANHKFTITFNNASSYPGSTALNFSYQLDVPAGTADGTVFPNHIAGGSDATDANAIYVSAGGNGGGTGPGGIKITKTDSADSTKLLAGAVFEVKDATDTVVGQIATDTTGTGTLAGLAAGTYTVVETTAPTGYSVNATATTVIVTAGGTATVTITNTLIVTPRTAALSLVKTADATALTNPSKVGETIIYRFTATNTGNTPLTAITIVDPLTGLSTLSYTWPGTAGTLAPGEKVDATATYQITQADINAGKVDNTATATGKDPAGTDVHSSPSNTTTTLTASLPVVVPPVVDPPAVVPPVVDPPAAVPPVAAAPVSHGLAATGVTGLVIISIALLMLLGGFLALATGRRRKPRS